MPKLNPLELTLYPGNPEEKTETYDPTSNTGTNTTLVDSAPEMVYDAHEIRVTVRPAGPGNTGRNVEILGIRPIPLSEDCCTDVTKPEGNTFRINTMIRKTASAAQAADLVEMVRAFVASADFKDLVTKSSYYS